MIQRYHLEQLDQYDYVVASYANQQLFLRAATKHHYIIRPRFLTAHEMLELVTFKSPSHLDALVVKHLQLNPGFASTVEEILRSPNLSDIDLPYALWDFYQQLIQENVITPRVYLAPGTKIGLLGPITPLLKHYLTPFDVEPIMVTGLDSTIEYTSFDTQYDEVVAVMEEVTQVLSEQGFGQVALFVNDESYFSYLTMMAKRHHVPLELQQSNSVLLHPVVAAMFNEFKSNPTLDHFVSLLSRLLIDESETLASIHQKITRWISEYQSQTLSTKETILLVKHALETMTYRPPTNQHVVKVYTSFSQPIEEPYLIVLGVNQGVLPAVVATSRLISDTARGELGLTQNKDKNQIGIDEFILQVSLQDRVWLTAKARSASQVYAQSVLLKHPAFGPLIKHRDVIFSRPIRFSKAQDLITYKKMRFQQQRQGFYTDELEFLHYHYESKLPPPLLQSVYRY